MQILLDTHVFLWFSLNDPRLPKTSEDLIRDRTNSVSLSIASLWEISIKSGLSKLTLGAPFMHFVDSAVTKKRIKILPVSVLHLAHVEQLPRHHRDPFDRMIIAQSMVEKCQVMTVDPQFEKYNIQLVR